MENVILYSENGDKWHGEKPRNEAVKILKDLGYLQMYSGRVFTKTGQKVLVGINNKNTVNQCRKH